MIKRFGEKEFVEKLVEHMARLYYQAELDSKMYGDGWIELTDRKIEVVSPKRVMINTNKKGKIISYEVKKDDEICI